jgi:hypothetical protein
MTIESQQIAIAEACGWKYTDNDPEQYPYWLSPKGDSRYGNPLDANLFPKAFPDYLGDLNAIHEAEKLVDIDRYVVNLCQVHGILQTELFYANSHGTMFLLLRSTAAQRAEAFLRTIGKWEGSK